MGIIRAIGASVKGVMEDQWIDHFQCDSLGADILLKRQYRVNNGSNKGNPDVISSGSTIVVNEGQGVIVVENGKILDSCIEPGVHFYKSDASPSLLAGSSVKSISRDVWDRVGFGGESHKVQRVYYVNMLPINGIRFQTRNPIPLRISDDNIWADLDLSVIAEGVFSFRIADPCEFYRKVARTCLGYALEDMRDHIVNQFLSCLMATLPDVAGCWGVRPSEMVKRVPDLEKMLKDTMTERMTAYCGIEIVSIAFDGLSLTGEDGTSLTQYQYVRIMEDGAMAGAVLTDAMATAVSAGAGNPTGAFTGLAVAVDTVKTIAKAFETDEVTTETAISVGTSGETITEITSGKGMSGFPALWLCTCGTENKGKFCTECGEARKRRWKCACGNVATSRFCPECGTRMKESKS